MEKWFELHWTWVYSYMVYKVSMNLLGYELWGKSKNVHIARAYSLVNQTLWSQGAYRMEIISARS